MNADFFKRRFALIKDQEHVCFKLLKLAGVFLGNEQAAVFDDYDLDVRNKNDAKRLLDIKIGKTLFIDSKNPLPNEQDFYYLKQKTFNKYCRLAETEDFYLALFHCFFLEEEAKLTERVRQYGQPKQKHQLKIKREISCLLFSVNSLKEKLWQASHKIQLHQKIKDRYLAHPHADSGSILKIDSNKIGVKLDLKNYWRQLTKQEQQTLIQSP